MKINGKVFNGAFIKTVVLPRGNDRIVFRAQAILSFDDFHALCEQPKPPMVVHRGGKKTFDVEDEKYLKDITEWSGKKTAYLIIQSLKATEGLEWDTVKEGDPDTWNNYQEELRDAGLTNTEISILVDAVTEANGMDEEKIKAATNDFLQEEALAE